MSRRLAFALWARVFTPTSEVSVKCTSSPSSPASMGAAFSGDAREKRRGRWVMGHTPEMRAIPRVYLAIAALAIALTLTVLGSSASTASTKRIAADPVDLATLGWVWPAVEFRLDRVYVQPAHKYAAGHRGVDLDLVGGMLVRAPAAGTIAFSGSVAGRGILTIDHGGGLVTTLEPVESPLEPGMLIGRGEDVATLTSGGHTAPGALHFGVRLDGEYINPLLLLGGVPRAVLLPCCD